MATLEEGLISYLTGYAGLTALISTRVHVLKKPRAVAYPCVTFQRISSPIEHTQDEVGAGSSLTNVRMQFDAWAPTEAAAMAISAQLTAALNGKRGTIGTTYQVTIGASLKDDEVPDFDEVTGNYRSRSEYLIRLEE